MNHSFKYFLLLTSLIFLAACGSKEPTNIDVEKAVKEYEKLPHNVLTEWNGVKINIPTNYSYTKIEKLSCTMIGDAEAICSVNTSGKSSIMNVSISNSFSGVDKFHLFKENGVWRTEDAIEQSDKSLKNSDVEKPINNISYEEFKSNKLQEGWTVKPKRNATLTTEEEKDAQYCEEGGYCTVEFLNPKYKNQVLDVLFVYCSKELNNCDGRNSGKELQSEKIISNLEADKKYKLYMDRD